MTDTDIRRALEQAPKEQLNDKLEELALCLNITRKALQARALKAGFRMRGERSNKGQTIMDEKTLDIIATRVLSSKKSSTNEYLCSVKKAIEDVRKEGLEVPVGYQRVCVLLREREYDKASLAVVDPHIRLISLHPNHVHQFDVTNCMQWHFKHNGGLKEESIKWLYSSKMIEKAAEHNKKPKLLRFVLIDHCSGSFFFWYYYTSGERPSEGADFFLRAWSKKQSLIEKTLGLVDYTGAYQFHGVPKILMSDKGSILTTTAMVNLMKALDVKVILHKEHNPRAKGMVERHMQIIGMGFETDLRFNKFQNLDDLNAAALDWCIQFNINAPFRLYKKRATLWLNIKNEELRICPPEDVYFSLITGKEETRNINGNGELSYKGQAYWCNNSNVCNKKVVVKMNLKDHPNIDVHYSGKVYVAVPVAYDKYRRLITPTNSVIGEEYKQHKQTKNQKTRSNLEEIGEKRYGLTYEGKHKKRIAKPTTKDILPEQQTVKDNVIYIQKEGVQLETPNPYEPLTEELYVNIHDRQTHQVRLITPAELIKRFVTAYGKLTLEQNKYIRATYSNGVPEDISITELYNALNTQEATDAKKIS